MRVTVTVRVRVRVIATVRTLATAALTSSYSSCMPLSAASLAASSSWQRSYSFITAKASSSSFLNCALVASILPSSSVAPARCLAMLAWLGLG